MIAVAVLLPALFAAPGLFGPAPALNPTPALGAQCPAHAHIVSRLNGGAFEVVTTGPCPASLFQIKAVAAAKPIMIKPASSRAAPLGLAQLDDAKQVSRAPLAPLHDHPLVPLQR